MAKLRPADFIKVISDFVNAGDKTIPVVAEIGVDLVKDFAPYAKLTFDRTYRTFSNQYVLPRGLRLSPNDIVTTFNLKDVIQPTLAEGGADAVQLTKQLGYATVFSRAEMRGWYANSELPRMNTNEQMEELWSYFHVNEVKRNIDIKQEIEAIKAIDEASTANFTLIRGDDSKINAYQTLVNIGVQLSDKGIAEYQTKVYVSNQFYKLLMKDAVVIANGQSSIQSTDVRYGLDRGEASFMIADLVIIRDPVVKNVTKTVDDQTLTAGLVVCPKDNLFLIYNEVCPLKFVSVPEFYKISALQLQYFRYYNVYVQDPSVTGIIYCSQNDYE